MNLRDYIEMGEMEAGSQVKLAEFLMMNPANIRNAKRGTQGIPDAMCIKLAKLIGVTEIEVIAASNLVTEKNPERRKIFEGCLATLSSIAFAMLLAVNSSTSEAQSMLQNNAIQTSQMQFIHYK
jgi:predicted patatin/cPLA2 family phospholipase